MHRRVSVVRATTASLLPTSFPSSSLSSSSFWSWFPHSSLTVTGYRYQSSYPSQNANGRSAGADLASLDHSYSYKYSHADNGAMITVLDAILTMRAYSMRKTKLDPRQFDRVIEIIDRSTHVNMLGISTMLGALNIYKQDDYRVKDLLILLTSRLIENSNSSQCKGKDSSSQCKGKGKDSLEPKEMGIALFGFKNMKNNIPEVRDILSALIMHIALVTKPLAARDVGKVLFGMRNMDPASSSQTRDLLAVVIDRIRNCPETLEDYLGNAFYNIKNMSANVMEVRRLVAVLTYHLSLCAPGSLSARNVCSILYSLNNMSSDIKEVRDLLSVLAKHVSQCSEPFSARGVSNALYGLKNMNSECLEVRNMLRALESQISRCTEPFNGQTIGNALYGLNKMDSSYVEVRRLFASLGTYLQRQECKAPLTAQEVGNALYGLKSASSDHQEVRQVLGLLVRHITGCQEVFSAQAISSSLYGLQKMSSKHEEVRGVLKALLTHITEFPDVISTQGVANALFGLKSMNCSEKEVRDMLSVLSAHISRCTGNLTSHQLTVAVYSLHNMDSNVREVNDIVQALVALIQSQQQQLLNGPSLQSRDVGQILYGLRRMRSDHMCVRKLLEVLLPLIEQCESPPDSRGFGNSLYGLQRMNSRSEEVQNLLSALNTYLSRCYTMLSPQSVGNALYGLQVPSTLLCLL